AQVVADALEDIARNPQPEPQPQPQPWRPSDLDDVEVDVEVVEEASLPPPRTPPPLRTPRPRRRPRRRYASRGGGNRWERRVMALAWVTGIGVVLLILFLIIRHRYFKRVEEDPPSKAAVRVEGRLASASAAPGTRARRCPPRRRRPG